MTSRTYSFHGVQICVTSDSAELTAAIDSRLRLFAKGDGRANLAMTYSTQTKLASRPDGDSRALYEIPGFEFSYFPATDQIYVRRPKGLELVCDPASGRAYCSIESATGQHLWLASHVMFTLPLVEMLKRRGIFAVHAGAVAIDGRCILFPGITGSGKSTTSISLVRAGMSFLGDDTVFLRSDPAGLRVLAFPDEIDITDKTARLFPELNAVIDAPRRDGWPKHQLLPEVTYRSDVAWDCAPAVLAFPFLALGTPTSVEPMPQREALLELMPNVPVTDAPSSQAHLDSLADLVRGTRSYRLRLGSDLARLPDLVRDLVYG